MGGWGLQAFFDGEQLTNWRQLAKQIHLFVLAHTLKNTTGLPSTDLSWLGDAK
jgi:hypothetical protein